MVTITNATQKQSDKGPFVALELSGDIEMVQSQSTLRYDATVRKCTVVLRWKCKLLKLQLASSCLAVLLKYPVPSTSTPLKRQRR
jgi:hypothetical protein